MILSHTPRRWSRSAVALLALSGLASVAHAGVFEDPSARFSAFGSSFADLRDNDQNLSDSELFPFQLVGSSHSDALETDVTLDASGAAMRAESFINLTATATSVLYDLDVGVESTPGNPSASPAPGPGQGEAIAKLSTTFFIPAGFVGEWSFTDFTTYGVGDAVAIRLFRVGTRGPSEGYDLDFDNNANPSDNSGLLTPGEFIIESEITIALAHSTQAGAYPQAGVAFSFNVILIPTPPAAGVLAAGALLAMRRRRTPARA